MPKRKYTRIGEVAQGYECCNKKCKWQGTKKEWENKEVDSGHWVSVCPNCGNDDFYGLLEYTKEK